jgi:uncharacterized protein YegJ (DUF2314 family)
MPMRRLFFRATVPSLVLLCGLYTVAAQNAPPKDKPVSAVDAQVKKFEDAIAPYVKQARDTLPDAKKKYLAGLPKGQVFFVTIRLYEDKKFEQAFLAVMSWKDKTIEGVLASNLDVVQNHKRGDKLTCQESDVFDWTISKPDGTEEGNFVGKFLDTYQP